MTTNTKRNKYILFNSSIEITGNKVISSDFETGNHATSILYGEDLIRFRLNCIKDQLKYNWSRQRPIQGYSFSEKEEDAFTITCHQLERIEKILKAWSESLVSSNIPMFNMVDTGRGFTHLSGICSVPMLCRLWIKGQLKVSLDTSLKVSDQARELSEFIFHNPIN